MTTSPNALRPCTACGGPAPLTQDDSSHDDCGTAASPHGGRVPVVASVPKTAAFQFAYDGHNFYLLKIGAVVAVAKRARPAGPGPFGTAR